MSIAQERDDLREIAMTWAVVQSQDAPPAQGPAAKTLLRKQAARSRRAAQGCFDSAAARHGVG